MDTEQRIALIRAKCGLVCQPIAKPKGVYLATTPEAVPATLGRKRTPIRGGEVRGAPHVTETGTRRLREIAPWIAQPDPEVPEEWQPKPRRGMHPLTKIAQQLPAKLPVISIAKWP